jgi:hypothetical protein
MNLMSFKSYSKKWIYFNQQITSGLVSGTLEVRPEKIRADDRDTLRNEILYSFSDGSPENFKQFFGIDSR